MSWRSPQYSCKTGLLEARLIERWLRDQQGSMLVCRKQVVWRDQYGPTPRWDPRYRNGRRTRYREVGCQAEVAFGIITFITRMTWFWVPQSGHCSHCTSRLSLSATARVTSRERGSHATHVTVHLTLLSLRPLASLHHQTPQYPRRPHSALPRKGTSFLLSKGDPADLRPPSVPGCRCSRLCKRPFSAWRP